MKNRIVAVVGGESPLGRELRDQLSSRKFPIDLRMAGADEQGAGVIDVQDDEPVVMAQLDHDVLDKADIVFLAGSPDSSRRAWELVRNSTPLPLLIDLAYGLEDRPDARLRFPWLDSSSKESGSIQVGVHPAALALATLYSRIPSTYTVRHSVVQILEPASERGQAGLRELQQQTASLLSFRTLEKAVYDAQASFNVLPRYGVEAPLRLEEVEQRIDRHVATLFHSLQLGPMPSLRLAQAPVFHGYSFSIWIEFEETPNVTHFSESIAGAQIEVRAAGLEPPTNVGAVGQSGISVGVIESDRNHPKALWVWAVADNYRLVADNAIEIARPRLERVPE